MSDVRILFWDIDGTLLTTKRAGVFALEEAAREVCGAVPDFAALQTSGLTDHEVAVLAIETCGGEATEPETAAAFLRSYERHLPDRLGLRKGGPMPASSRSSTTSTDATTSSRCFSPATRGRRAREARALRARPLLRRRRLLPRRRGPAVIARRALEIAAERAGADLDPDTRFVIGDTPHDVSCGQGDRRPHDRGRDGRLRARRAREHDPWLALEGLPGPEEMRRMLDLPA